MRPRATADGGFWAQLGVREQALVLAVAHERRVGAGRRLLYEGPRGRSLALIPRGRVKISSVTIDGEERLLAFEAPVTSSARWPGSAGAPARPR